MSTGKTAEKIAARTPADETSERLRKQASARYYEGDANLIALDIVAKEYEPRVAKLESQLADLLKRLGEEGAEQKRKGG